MIFTPQTKTLPEFVGLVAFGCLSDAELNNKPQSLRDAELLNKKGFISANNGETDKALLILDKAISLGSLNAVNNKFAVLHGAERYHEAFEHLEGIVDTSQATVLGLYNLAVLYYNGEFDTFYNLKKDTAHSYLLLQKANLLNTDNIEVGKEHCLERVNDLILRLESEDSALLKIKDSIKTQATRTKKIDNKDSEIEKKIPSASVNIQFQDSTTTDIYGQRLLKRLSDIYYCIHAGAEGMASQLFNLPKVSKEGMMEFEILMAAILSNQVEKGIVLQAMLSGNPSFNEVGLTDMSEAMELYLKQYRTQILRDDIKNRSSLLDFAKIHGQLKLATLEDEKTGEISKIPVFVDNNKNIIKCRFLFFAENEKTSDYIIKNKNSIFIDETKEGEYLFRLKRDLEYDYNFFMKIIAYNIYCSPLNYQNRISINKIDSQLAHIKRMPTNVIVAYDIKTVEDSAFHDISDICPYISYALYEGSRIMRALAVSLGIISSH